jgi:hypothetical protein
MRSVSLRGCLRSSTGILPVSLTGVPLVESQPSAGPKPALSEVEREALRLGSGSPTHNSALRAPPKTRRARFVAFHGQDGLPNAMFRVWGPMPMLRKDALLTHPLTQALRFVLTVV